MCRGRAGGEVILGYPDGGDRIGCHSVSGFPRHSHSRSAMSTPPPNKDGQGSSPPWCQPPAAPSRTPSASAAMSVPSLSLWSRKIALQSEELAALIQSSATKLLLHQEQLEELLKNCKIDIANSKKEIEAVSKQRNDEGMS